MWYTSTEEIGCTHVVEFRYFPRGIADDWVKQTVKPMWLHLQTAHRTYTLYHTPLTASECCRTIRNDQQYEYAHAWPLVWANCQHRREANKTRSPLAAALRKPGEQNLLQINCQKQADTLRTHNGAHPEANTSVCIWKVKTAWCIWSDHPSHSKKEEWGAHTCHTKWLIY